MDLYKKWLDFTQLWIYTLAVWVISIISFITFNSFNNTASSTSSITKAISNFDNTELKKLKIEKQNISWVYQLKNGIKDSEVLSITLDWKTNLWDKSIWIWYASANLSTNKGDDKYSFDNFSETDFSNPQAYVFSQEKLSWDAKWLTYVWTGTLIWSDKTVNTFVYKVFDKVNTAVVQQLPVWLWKLPDPTVLVMFWDPKVSSQQLSSVPFKVTNNWLVSWKLFIDSLDMWVNILPWDDYITYMDLTGTPDWLKTFNVVLKDSDNTWYDDSNTISKSVTIDTTWAQLLSTTTYNVNAGEVVNITLNYDSLLQTSVWINDASIPWWISYNVSGSNVELSFTAPFVYWNYYFSVNVFDYDSNENPIWFDLIVNEPI